MKFAHISDTHLGLIQYNLEERENDIYDAFGQAIDISIKEHVDFVIIAGDIFHSPTPSGTAIMQMAHALKKLKQNNIDSFFILGEHDISRVRSYPVPYVYHKLGFSQHIGDGKPIIYKGVMLVGFDKIRKNEMENFTDRFNHIKEHKGHKILVLHQGITEVNKFASELTVNDLPKNFTYYAMGHLHDHCVRKFDALGGPLVYPGSIELTSSEGIKETEKGFYLVDLSDKAEPSWVPLDYRPQISIKTKFEEMPHAIQQIMDKFKDSPKKPITEIIIDGDVKPEQVQAEMSRLLPTTLHHVWKISKSSNPVVLSKQDDINGELLRLGEQSLGSKELAEFAIKELLPLLVSGDIQNANNVILQRYEVFK